MISAILAVLGSSAFGSVIGGVFGVLNKRNDLEVKKLDLNQEQARWGHDLAMRDKDLAMLSAEAAAKKDVAIVEADGSIETARMVAIGQSHAADALNAEELRAAGNWRGVLVGINGLNRIVRPALTLIVCGAALYLNWLLLSALVQTWPELDKGQRFELGTQAFAWLTGQASAVLGYWFVSRGSSR